MYRHVLAVWPQRRADSWVTWETMMESLEDIGHGSLASNLRRELEP